MLDCEPHRITLLSCARLQVSIRLFSKPGNRDGVIHHVDVLESSKKGSAGHLQLATPLTVSFPFLKPEQCVFEDLDELHSAFVKPYVEAFLAIKSSSKYVPGDQDAVHAVLAKAERMDYRLALDTEKPGLGYIAWVHGPGRRAHHCPFSVTHVGYHVALSRMSKLQPPKKVTSKNVDALIRDFKTHMQHELKQQAANGGGQAPGVGAPRGGGGGHPSAQGGHGGYGQQPSWDATQQYTHGYVR